MSKSKKIISKEIFSGKAILQGMPELAYVFDEEGRILKWNKNVELVLNYTKEELKHKFILDFIDEPFRKNVFDVFTDVFLTGKDRTVEYRILTKSGKKIPYLGSGSLTVVGGKKYLTGIAIDISKLKETEKKLKSKIDQINSLKIQLQSDNEFLRKEIKSNLNFDNLIGKSKASINALNLIEKVAPTISPVLLKGEIGTRKELYARAIHDFSTRRNKPFVKVNCIALQKKTMEDNFFGNKNKDIIGSFELSKNGTLFIDEISEIPLDLQSKLLTVFQNNKYNIIGDSKIKSLDIRIILATNKNLDSLIKTKQILKDLFFYINVFPIDIPPLRERISDIPLLVEYFVKQFNQKFTKNIKTSKKALALLQSYSWPGNSRELENIIERAIILSNTSLLKVEHIIITSSNINENVLTLEDYKKEYIVKILNKTFWRISGDKGAAKILNIHPETLRSKMKKLKIKRP